MEKLPGNGVFVPNMFFSQFALISCLFSVPGIDRQPSTTREPRSTIADIKAPPESEQ